MQKALQSLDITRAIGLDELLPRLLQVAAPSIYYSLTIIINKSIQPGCFPDISKLHKLIPIHKCGSLLDRGNFRPITILPALSKLTETHLNLIHIYQSGLRHLYPCETALAHMLHTWTSAINRDLMNGSLYRSQTSFDIVDHDIFLKKLQIYHCSENTIKWFKSYLTDRSQHTSFGRDLSDKVTVTDSMPQGSILCPLLFILFIYDMPLHTK